jgi:GntR family transcriptional regulator
MLVMTGLQDDMRGAMTFPDPPNKPLANIVDYDSPLPYYVQVKRGLQRRIAQGDWRPGDQLPGEKELCDACGVSRTVIRQALGEMEYEGLIVRRKGKGTFVAEPKIVEGLFQKLTGFYQDMVARGHRPLTKVLKQVLVPAGPDLAARLKVAPETDLVQIDRLRFVEDEPIVWVTTYLPYVLCPKVLHADLADRSLYAFLEEEYGLVIARGHRTIEAVPANEDEARLLQVEKGAPLLLLDSISYLQDGTPIEVYHALHRGDRSKFEVELVRIEERGSRKAVLGEDLAELPPGSALVHR